MRRMQATDPLAVCLSLEKCQLAGFAFPFGSVGQGFLADIDHRPLAGEFGIQFKEVLLAFGDVVISKDGTDRAFRFTQRAVDAFIGIDDEEIGAFMEAVHRADIDTVGVFAFDTVFNNNVGHGIPDTGEGLQREGRVYNPLNFNIFIKTSTAI